MGRAGELPRTTVRQFANASHCRENKRLLQVGLQSDLRPYFRGSAPHLVSCTQDGGHEKIR